VSSGVERRDFLLGLQESCGGAIPFDRWMQAALYHPGFGYYTAGIRTVGRHGDFSTWPTMHESLSSAIAGWLKQNKPSSGRWQVIEVGAGTGELAAGILKACGWWSKPRYHIVEASPILRGQQEKLLRRSVTWHESVAQALKASEGNALIFSNELVDAFPCRIFQRQNAGWRELALRIENNRIYETWIESPLPDSSIFECEWPVGQRVEIHESFRQWMAEWLPLWRSGAMLTIDYGDRPAILYSRRPSGTIRAFFHHQRLYGTEIYAGMGTRDITADVNFSDLARWGEKAGLRTISEQTIGDFIVASAAKAPPPQLLDADGAGGAFKVLIQAR